MGQTKDNKIDIYCLYAKHAWFKNERKDFERHAYILTDYSTIKIN